MEMAMKKDIFILFLILVWGCSIQQPLDITPLEQQNIKEAPIAEITSPEINMTVNNIAEIFPPRPPIIEEPLTFEEKVWKQRIDRAMAHSFCPPVKTQTYPENYYQGPLIDSHFHIGHLPDSSPGEEAGEEALLDDEEDDPENTWEDDEERQEDEQQPVLGRNIRMSEIVCTLQHEGTKKVFAFFPVFPEIHEHLLDVADMTMQQYADYFVPFIMPPGEDNTPSVNAETLRKFLKRYPHLFVGYGEIGYGSDFSKASQYPPDASFFHEIYRVVQENNLIVYFHPLDGQEDDIERLLQKYPQINFIVHGEGIEDEIGDLMSKYPNLYFTANDLYGDQYLLHPRENVDSFLAATKNYELLLRKDINTWKRLIEQHPDQFLWGTDRGGIAVWTLDQRVGQRLTDYARAFIGRLDPSVQEKFAYKNAERLINMSGKKG